MGFYNWQISPCGRNDEGIEPARVLESLKWRQSRHFRLSKTLNFSLYEWVISTAGRNLLVLRSNAKSTLFVVGSGSDSYRNEAQNDYLSLAA